MTAYIPQPDGGVIKFSLSDSLSHAGDSVDNLASYLDADSYAALQALADEKRPRTGYRRDHRAFHDPDRYS